MAVPAEVLGELQRLNDTQAWAELAARAEAEVAAHPDAADLYGYVAHAKRQLGELEDGYAWAVRGVAVDPRNTFAVNRKSLLANLTGRYAESLAAARSILDREPTATHDPQNIAVTIVNGIFAASKLGTIAEAVELFTPVIERLDHDELHFNSACMYALAHDDRVFAYVAKALAAAKPKTAFDDGDFDGVRADPRFVELLARDWVAEQAALARSHKSSRAELRPEDFIDPACFDREPGTATARNHELERAIEANVDDPAGYAVYSDWLQERLDPLGTFVLASRRCLEAVTEGERMLAYVDWAEQLHGSRWIGAFGAHLAGPSRAVWQHGFIRELVFDLGAMIQPETARSAHAQRSIDAPKLLAEVLALRMCRFVQSLSISDIAASHTLDYAPVVAALVDASLPCLRALDIGQGARRFAVSGPPDWTDCSWSYLDTTGIAERFPALESLVLGAGDFTIGALDFPQLRRFAIHTGGLTRANLDAIVRARWPVLEDLEIWFGTTEYGADAFTGLELAPILAGRTLPRLTRLGLMNAELTDAICGLLVDAPIVAQLTELDLSMGTMTDDGARTLAAAAPRLRHLARLVIADNCLSDEAAIALAAALPNVVNGRQKTDRYVTVGE